MGDPFSPHADTGARRVRNRYAVLAVLSCALYLKSVRFGFLLTWDDADYVVDNPLVRSLSLENLLSLFTQPTFSNYAPLHILTYGLGHALWGGNAAGYHLVNILVHALNACLVYRLVCVLTGQDRTAFWAALLFTVHPVNVENVAWISESKTLFAHAFGLLAFLQYAAYRERGSRAALGWGIAAFSAGLLYKVSIAPLPLMMLAYDRFLRRERPAWAALAPFFAVSGLGAVLAVWAQTGSGGGVDTGLLSPAFLFGTVYPTMVPVFWKYLGLLLAPFGLSGHYDTAIYSSFLALPVLASLIAMIAALSLLLGKGSGQVRFWTLWFCLLLLPVSNIVPLPVYYADRYLYSASIGCIVLLVLAGEWAVQRFNVRGSALPAVLGTAVLVFGIASFTRLEVWRNDLVFWEDTVRTSPNLAKPRLNLGIAYEMAGRLDDAERELALSMRVSPTEEARYHLAMVRAKKEYLKKR